MNNQAPEKQASAFAPAAYEAVPTHYEQRFEDIVPNAAYIPNGRGEVFKQDAEGQYRQVGNLASELAGVSIAVQAIETPAEAIAVQLG